MPPGRLEEWEEDEEGEDEEEKRKGEEQEGEVEDLGGDGGINDKIGGSWRKGGGASD